MAETICETCRLLNFCEEHIMEPSNKNIWARTWKEICEQTLCPWCRLVRKSLLSSLGRELVPRENEYVYLSRRLTWRDCIAQNRYQMIGNTTPYSNKFDLQDHGLLTGTNFRCQFRAKAASAGFPDVFIRPLSSGTFAGRRVDSAHADLDLVRNWLKTCETYHSPMCNYHKTSRSALPRGFRLIDVNINKIETSKLDSKPNYVALTYVWGEDKMMMKIPRTLRASVHPSEKGVELIDLPKVLPRTIRDAMEVTRCLGFTYLWVDSLCIIQDDKVDRHNQINMMDKIYGNAALTIAAGSSPHANWGLPGISIPRLVSQATERIGIVEYAVGFPSFDQIDDNMHLLWNSRGWTLQEKLLSKRLLLFTDMQMDFRCGNSSFAEDIAMETGLCSRNVARKPNPLRFGTFDYFGEPKKTLIRTLGALVVRYDVSEEQAGYLPSYIRLLEDYSRRKLTDRNDILDAISGILRKLEASDGSDLVFCAGLPRRYLPQSLLWQPGPGSYSIDYETRTKIPTWSWAAWSLTGGCTIPGPVDTAFLGNWRPIMIYYKDSDGRLSCVESGHAYMPGERCETELSATVQKVLDQSGVLLGLRTCVGEFGIGDSLVRANTDRDDELNGFYLTDEAGRRIGLILTSSKVAAEQGNHQYIALSTRKISYKIFLVAVDPIYQPKISEKKFSDTSSPPFISEKSQRRSGEGGLSENEWTITDVMLVKWRDDVALRVAIGHIISTAFEWKPERIVYLG